MLMLTMGSVALPASAKHPIPWWSTAKLVRIDRHGLFERYTIENQMCRLTGRRFLLFGHPRLTVGKPVKYSEVERSLYVIDESGKEYKLRFVLQALMAPPPPESTKRNPSRPPKD